jgi:hypothetical protein
MFPVLSEDDLKVPLTQCCGSGRFLTGSGSDFQKRPDPVRFQIRIRSHTSGSGYDQKDPDPTGSRSATLLLQE